MHPEIRQNQPGLCPECGMNLIQKEQKSPPRDAGETYDKHAGHSTRVFIRKFWISLALTIPVVLYSELPERVFGWQAPQFSIFNFQLSNLLPLVLSSIVFFYCGWVFLAGAYRELRARLPGMMTLIGIAITTAYLYSVAVEISAYRHIAFGHTLFWELTTLVTIMLLGHWIEMRAVQGAQGALKELSKLLPDTAEVITQPTTNNQQRTTKIVPLSELKEGDTVFVRPGGKIPADGVVADGDSEVDESMITGESKPVAKKPPAEVIAGTINGDGALAIRITKIGEYTFLAGVMRLVREAQASKSRLQLLSDKAAYYLTLIAVGGGVATFFLWMFIRGNADFAIERLVAVLVITCPHALGLAVPLVASISTTLSARAGLLVRDRRALEAARNITVVLFDKTGTLTAGAYGVEKIWAIGAHSANDVLGQAASVDAHSEHFIARAIVARAKTEHIALRDIAHFQRIPGRGVKAEIDGKEIFVGGFPMLEYTQAAPRPEFEKEVAREDKLGKTIIFVVVEKEIIGALALADTIRTESREAVRALTGMGVRVAMITGDSADVAAWVAKELGIGEYFARVLPQEKSAKVKLLQEQGMKVAMVGDGINDAPALIQADLGIAIGAGTNVAIASAGIILVKNDPRDIVKIITLSRLTYAKMMQNLFWATGYNVIAIPLAAGTLASYGIFLQPAVSALLMSLSTVIVAVNALLLRKTKLYAREDAPYP